jgi:hypothetical protein
MPNRRLRIAIIPPASGSLEISFGAKTRSGHGGYPVGQAAGSAITGTGASDWRIDERGHIVPSGTYGAFKTYSRSIYSLTLADATPVTITIAANKAHVREVTAVAQGGTATVNADINSAGHQAATLLNLVGSALGSIARGDTIIGRTGHFNPKGLGMRLRPAATGWVDGSNGGSGRVTFTSEVIDTTTDAYGHNNNAHGFKISSLAIDGTSVGTAAIPLDFRQVHFYSDNPDPAQPIYLFKMQNDSGRGIGFYDCGVTTGPSVPESVIVNLLGLSMNSDNTIERCTFRDVLKAIACKGGCTIKWNVAQRLRSDFVAWNGATIDCTDNFVFDWETTPGAHGDYVQHQGNPSGTDVPKVDRA